MKMGWRDLVASACIILMVIALLLVPFVSMPIAIGTFIFSMVALAVVKLLLK